MLPGGCRCCNESLPGVYSPLIWIVERSDRDHCDPDFIHWLGCPSLPKGRADLRCFPALGSSPTIARLILFSLVRAPRDYNAVEFVRGHFSEEGPGAYGFCHEAGEAQEQVERRGTQKPSGSLPAEVSWVGGLRRERAYVKMMGEKCIIREACLCSVQYAL